MTADRASRISSGLNDGQDTVAIPLQNALHDVAYSILIVYDENPAVFAFRLTPRLSRHSNPVISRTQPHVLARFDVCQVTRFRSELNDISTEGQMAASGHPVAGIHGKIQKVLFQLTAIHVDMRLVFAQQDGECDAQPKGVAWILGAARKGVLSTSSGHE